MEALPLLMGALGAYVSGRSNDILIPRGAARDFERGFSRLAQYAVGFAMGEIIGRIALAILRTITPFTFSHPIVQICMFAVTVLIIPTVPTIEKFIKGLIPVGGAGQRVGR
jgi:hypothetical protein